MPMQSPSTGSARPASSGPSRRTILIGGGAGAGLVLAWSLWPRRLANNLTPVAGETVINAYLKIAEDGRVTVVVPQIEMGQGVWTALPQALADELGADWRQIAVEPAPISPIYANAVLAEEHIADTHPSLPIAIDEWLANRYATRHALMITAGSSSIRAFEQPFRQAGAAARAMLCMAAARRLGIDWAACDTKDGFVVRGDDRFRFGELAAEAAGFEAPDPPPLRRIGEGGISGKPIQRIDLPAKVDGSVRFAGDVRVPGLVHAAVRHGPLGATRVSGGDVAAAKAAPGVIGVVRREGWIAVAATSWWSADRAFERLKPTFTTAGALPATADVDHALAAGLTTTPQPLIAIGDQGVFTAPGLVSADYAVPMTAHAAIEPLTATARLGGDRLEVWASTQSPSLTRSAVARATGMREGAITIYPMAVGGGFGRKLENDAAIEAAIIAIELKRPVQLTWSRAEEMQRARHRPPARARMAARLDGQRIAGWRATIATPAMMPALIGRLTGDAVTAGADRAALAGALPPYAIAAVSLAHVPVDFGIETGLWRSAAHSYTCFFTESFVDELAVRAALDPLSFRMSQLASNTRPARCLSRVTAAGGWSGQAGATQGLAIHSAFGSHIAVLAETAGGRDGVRVSRLFAAVDCGRVVNPDIVRQQIEGGLIWGLAAAFGGAMTYKRGMAEERTLDALKLPRLADTPEIIVEVIESSEAPGGVAELAVPVVAPAIANAIAWSGGARPRILPITT